jgi:hypothetical protein
MRRVLGAFTMAGFGQKQTSGMVMLRFQAAKECTGVAP